MELKKIGAWADSGGLHFRLWAPEAEKVEVVLTGDEDASYPMQKEEQGYFSGHVKDRGPGTKYKFRLNGENELPDPASRFQPEGPHGPSQVVEEAYAWTDQDWRGLSLSEMVIYEIHVGTFTPEGSFAAIETKIPHLKSLGINAIELMPVAQFAGKRNWGYDGVGLFSPQNSYGGKENSPEALKHLVDVCHREGLAVFLDVVYNHLGPEGNYLPQIGPYFQSKYKTPWGDALNYDGDWSDGVRNYFLQNARQWLEEYHFDGLRLDATHAIFDTSAKPFLEELSDLKNHLQKKLGRPLYLIAESETNDSRLLKPTEEGGLGLDGHWADDLHHVVHTLLTKENQGYYADYGHMDQLKAVFSHGLYFRGHYSPARHRRHGRSYEGIDRTRLVVCSQNHDQIGNRKNGERLISLVGPEKQKLAAACTLLSGALPLLFMGEEIAETRPFLYFVDHTDKELLEAVRKGRKEEFAGFGWDEDVPDPAAEETFLKSKIDWAHAEKNPRTAEFKSYYRRLIEISKWIRQQRLLVHPKASLLHDKKVLQVQGTGTGAEGVEMFFSFSEEPLSCAVDFKGRNLEIILDSSETKSDLKWSSGSLEIPPFSALVLRSFEPRK